MLDYLSWIVVAIFAYLAGRLSRIEGKRRQSVISCPEAQAQAYREFFTALSDVQRTRRWETEVLAILEKDDGQLKIENQAYSAAISRCIEVQNSVHWLFSAEFNDAVRNVGDVDWEMGGGEQLRFNRIFNEAARICRQDLWIN